MKWAARGVAFALVSLLPVSWAGDRMLPTVMPLALAGAIFYFAGVVADLLTARRNRVDERRGVMGLANWMVGRGHVDDYAPGTRAEVRISLTAVPVAIAVHVIIIVGRIAL